jgi:hypothetical protein
MTYGRDSAFRTPKAEETQSQVAEVPINALTGLVSGNLTYQGVSVAPRWPIFRLLVSNHVNDERQSSMKALKIIFQLIRRCLMGLFVAYWVIFIFYTVEKFITGGSSAVVG